MSQINTLIKPTHECNMRCSYCFHEKYGYSEEILEMKKLKKYISLLSEKYNYINIVWHGGEPLLVPLDYYEEIYDYCEKQDSTFLYSIQTNGTLLNQENIDFFKKNDTNIGLSFDGLSNEKTRSHTNKVLENIALLQDNGFYPGAVMVANQNNVDNLVGEYEYFKSLNLGMKINPMFNDGAAKKLLNFDLDSDVYISNFVDFFKYWANDTDCNISVSTCEDFVNLITNNYSGICTFNSCLGKWLCFDENGSVYPCDRLCVEEYNLGNIDDLVEIDQVFYSDNFINLLKNSINRRNNCLNECNYYENCYSGCNANAILGNIDGKNTSCYIQKSILKEIKNYIIESKNNISNMNPNYVKILSR